MSEQVGERTPATLPDAQHLADTLGVEFNDLGLLEQALIHRSYAYENGGLAHNERLEFLGDAVLGVVVTDEIYRAHPDAPEGRLAKVRSAAVKTHSLALVARQIGLGRLIRLGIGEANSGGADKDSILADTLEAVLGAVHIDQGLETAAVVIRRLFGPLLVELAEPDAALDHKTSLQELAAARFDTVPVYRVNGEGPDHEPTFTATVEVDGRVLGYGMGRTKKAAEQSAARQALDGLQADA